MLWPLLKERAEQHLGDNVKFYLFLKLVGLKLQEVFQFLLWCFAPQGCFSSWMYMWIRQTHRTIIFILAMEPWSPCISWSRDGYLCCSLLLCPDLGIISRTELGHLSYLVLSLSSQRLYLIYTYILCVYACALKNRTGNCAHVLSSIGYCIQKDFAAH